MNDSDELFQFRVPVYFNPAYKEDFVSRKSYMDLYIDYMDHPTYRVIELSSEVNFPNLEFSQSDINFGTSLCDIEMCTNIMLKNNGPLPAKYKWWFEVDQTGGLSFNPPMTNQGTS